MSSVPSPPLLFLSRFPAKIETLPNLCTCILYKKKHVISAPADMTTEAHDFSCGMTNGSAPATMTVAGTSTRVFTKRLWFFAMAERRLKVHSI